MAIRTVAADVRAIIVTDSDVVIDPFITTASKLTDKISANDTEGLLDDDLLFEIEKHLAAHFYQMTKDPELQSETASQASGTYRGNTDMFFAFTAPGQMAMALDLTGWLKRLNAPRRPKASVKWLGKKPRTEAIDYVDRD